MRVQVAAIFDGAVVDVRVVDEEYVIGDGREADLPLGCARHVLVRRAAGAWIVAPPGSVEVTLDRDACVRCEIAGVTFLVEGVAAQRVPRPLPIDWRAQAHTAAMALVAALLLALANAIPPEPASLSVDDLLASRRFPAFVIKAPQEEHPIEMAIANGNRGAGAAAKGPTGKMGKPNIAPHNGRLKLPGKTDLRLARLTAEERVQSSGIIGLVRASREVSSVGAIFGSDTALGPDAEFVMGHLVGTEPGEGDGVPGGLGTFGTQKGGGGFAQTIGVGRIPTGQMPGVAWRPNPKWRDKHETRIEPTPGPTRIIGGLDRELVRRTVRAHLAEVRFCYERELQTHPGLEGRVITGFTIGGNGAVLTSVVESSSLANPAAEHCIAEAVRRWNFPKPESAGVVVVSYPFVLRHAGAN
jgi:hypothetical protein